MPIRSAARMLYSAAGRTVLIEAKDDWSAQAVAAIFARWFLAPLDPHLVSQPAITLYIQSGVTPPPVPSGLSSFEIIHDGICHTDNQIYYVEFDRSLVIFGPGNTREVQLWIDKPEECSLARVTQLLSHALSPALRRCGVFEIHSGAVIAPGNEKAILIAGPSGSGKSTLTSQLTRCGWQYLSDDILLLIEAGKEIEVRAFRRFFALTAETLNAMKLSQRHSPSLSESRKVPVVPEDHFETVPVQRATAGIICFPGITGGSSTSVVRLTPTETMARLLRLCPWASYDHPTSAEHLRILGLLAHTTSAFELRTGSDVLHEPENVATILSELCSSALSV